MNKEKFLKYLEMYLPNTIEDIQITDKEIIVLSDNDTVHYFDQEEMDELLGKTVE